MSLKPIKKTDKELFALIKKKIEQGQYVFLRHAKQRMRERSVLELDVIYLLSGKKGYDRKRNKKKDTYELCANGDFVEDWKYCIEGCDIDGFKLRVIVTFAQNLMPIITVIRIGVEKSNEN